MIALFFRHLTLTMLLALLVVALLEQFNPAPPPMLVDFHRAQLAAPDDAHAVLQRCYPVAPKSDQPSVAIGSEQEPVT